MALSDWAVRDFTVEPAVHGPQIIVNWSFDGGFVPTGVSDLKLVRRERFHPADHTDGTTVHTESNAGAPTPFSVKYYSDTSVSDGVIYYYTMFAYVTAESAWKSHELTSGYALAFTTGTVASKIWSMLPTYEHGADAATTQTALTQTTVPESDPVHTDLTNPVRAGQVLHTGTHEYQDGRGFLFRLLQLVSTEFDRVYAITQHMMILHDVDRAPLDALQTIGDKVGVTVDVEASPERRREEIKRAVPVYRVKGTADGIASAVKVMIPWNLYFDECGDNILVFNREDRKFWNSADYYLMGSRGDTTHYLPGSGTYERNFDKVFFYFVEPVGSTSFPTKAQIQKTLERIIPKNLQASHGAIPVFVPLPELEISRLSIAETTQRGIASIRTGTARLTITETRSYTYSTRFLLTATAGVAANRFISDPNWVTPRRRT